MTTPARLLSFIRSVVDRIPRPAPEQIAPHIIEPGGYVLQCRHDDGVPIAVSISRGIMAPIPGCYLVPIDGDTVGAYRATLPLV